MKINIGDKNKIKDSNIGTNNKIVRSDKNILTEVFVGIIIAVIGGFILYFITK